MQIEPEKPVAAPSSGVATTANPSALARAWKFLYFSYGPFMVEYPKNFKDSLHLTWNELKGNVRSGITVALVNIPLSVALAIASGGAPIMGIVTCFWSGLILGLFGGSSFTIAGPTGALSGILAELSLRHKDPNIIPVVCCMAGVVILIAWLIRFDLISTFFSTPVVEGFTLGVSFIISLNQVNFALGLSGLTKHDSLVMNLTESILNITKVNLLAVAIFVVSLAILFICSTLVPKFPWVILIACAGSGIGIAVEYLAPPNSFWRLHTIVSQYGELKGALIVLPTVQWSFFNDWLGLIKSALYVAFVAIMETLISAKIADVMTNTKFSPPREVFGLGLANLVCGVFGGMPATCVLARTALNINNGATSRNSNIFNVVFVMIISFLLLPFFKYLILPVVAAILTNVAIRMVRWTKVYQLFMTDKLQFALTVLIALIAIVVAATEALLVGIVASLVVMAFKRRSGNCLMTCYEAENAVHAVEAFDFDTQVYNKMKPTVLHPWINPKTVKEQPDTDLPPTVETADMETIFSIEDTLVYAVLGDLNYFNAESHLVRLCNAEFKFRHIILDCNYLTFMDIDGAKMLQQVYIHAKKRKVAFVMCRVSADVHNYLRKEDWYQEMANYVSMTPAEALVEVRKPKPDDATAVDVKTNAMDVSMQALEETQQAIELKEDIPAIAIPKAHAEQLADEHISLVKPMVAATEQSTNQ